MRRQQIEEDALVGVLEGVHLALLLVGLNLPQEVEASGPLDLAAVQQHGEDEHEDLDDAEDVGGDDELDRAVTTLLRKRDDGIE